MHIDISTPIQDNMIVHEEQTQHPQNSGQQKKISFR